MGKLLMNVERDTGVIQDDKRIMKDKARILTLEQNGRSFAEERRDNFLLNENNKSRMTQIPHLNDTNYQSTN